MTAYFVAGQCRVRSKEIEIGSRILSYDTVRPLLGLRHGFKCHLCHL